MASDFLHTKHRNIYIIEIFIYYIVLLSIIMETLCIKVEDKLLGRINQIIETFGYSTKTEFVREAIRKKLEDDERDILIREFMKFRGKAKRKTTYEDNRKTREKVLLEMAKEKGWKI